MLSLLLSAIVVFSAPPQPTDEGHPGSSYYKYGLFSESFKVGGRTLDFFAPKEMLQENQKLTLIVFGHGQATPVSGYQMTFEHLAKKGFAVLFPQYDSGFFDQNWLRMGADFNSLTKAMIEKYKTSLSADRVVYAGHSKGGFVALTAAGLSSSLASSVVLMSPAGFVEQGVKNINPKVPVTLVWSSEDKIIKEDLVKTIYEKLQVDRKQMITVQSYADLKADHFFPMSKKFIFGGNDGTSAFHYYSVWPWLMGAATDLEEGAVQTNSYIYGDKAIATGIDGFSHRVIRNW